MNAKEIWSYFKDKGLNDFAIAGLMGNLYAESGLNPKNLQNNYEKKLGFTDETYTAAVDNGTYTNFVKDGAGYGLAQWTYWNRKQNLLNFSKEKNKSIGELSLQLDFLYKELTTSYIGLWKSLNEVSSLEYASDLILTQFEKPLNQSNAVKELRRQYATNYYNLYSSTISLYRVQIGAFSKRINAEKLQQEIRKKGFECIIKQVNNLYKCQVGAFSKRENAEAQLKKLKDAGFNDAFITK